jgi:hypothetical protein
MCPNAAERSRDYRHEARDIRAKAQEAHDAEARAQLLLIASLYEKLASLTDVRHVRTLRAKVSGSSLRDPTEGTDAV